MKTTPAQRAHGAVARAVLRRGPCEACGATVGVDAHHDDYAKPLDVRWLCRPHHIAHHREQGAYANNGAKAGRKPPPKHTVTDLYTMGLNQTEIARILRISRGSVSRQLKEASA